MYKYIIWQKELPQLIVQIYKQSIFREYIFVAELNVAKVLTDLLSSSAIKKLKKIIVFYSFDKFKMYYSIVIFS